VACAQRFARLVPYLERKSSLML